MGCALHTAVGFACPEADIQGECCIGQRIFLERVVNHPPRLVGVSSFESVVLYLADATQWGRERLSKIEESVAETDRKTCRLAFLCDALAVDVVLTVNTDILRCDGRIFVREDCAR